MKKTLGFTMALVALACLVPQTVQAQETIFSLAEVSEPPMLKNPQGVADAIQQAYPPVLRDRGISGKVQVRFVVNMDGKVDPETVEVVNSSVVGLGSAAVGVVKEFEFEPGKKDGTAVKTIVVFPIQFAAGN